MKSRTALLRTFLLSALMVSILWPVIELFLVELIKPASWRAVAGDGGLRAGGMRLLASSFGIALMAAALAIGVALIHFAVSLHLPRGARGAWLALAALPLFVPTHLLGLAWIQAVGRAGWITTVARDSGLPHAWLPGALYSAPGCAAILAGHFYPLALGALVLGWRGADAPKIEALTLHLAPGLLWRRVVRGWLGPWMTLGGIVVFWLSMLDYIIPFLLGRRVFAVEILTSFNLDYDPGKAAVLSLPLLAVAGGGVWISWRMLRRVDWTHRSRGEPRMPPLPGAPRAGLMLAGGLFVLVFSVLPLGTFFLWAGHVGNYQKIFTSTRPQIVSSLVWSGAAACVAVLLAGIVPETGAWRRFSLLRFAPVFLLAVPGSILGVAHIRFWNRNSPGDMLGSVYDSGLMLPLGLVGVVLPAAWLLAALRRRQCPEALIESARFWSPAGAARVRAATIRPFMFPAAVVGLWAAFTLAMHESHASILLAAPGQETLAIRTCTLLHFAPDSLLAALCLIALALMTAVSVCMLVCGRLIHAFWMRHASRTLLD